MRPPSTTKGRFALALAAAAALAAVLIGASLVGARSDPEPAPARPAASILDGIPQNGAVLGRPDAPVTLVEYADLQCPYCAEWSHRALPGLLTEYVRTGKLRIEFRGLAFIGRDSETALRAVIAAGRQDRLWHVLESLYHKQGAENAGWVTERLLDDVAVEARLDARLLEADRDAAWVRDAMLRAASQAGEAAVRGTPAFQLGRTGGPLRLVQPTSLGPDGLAPAIEQLLAS